MENSKPAYLSKTLWVNVIMAVLALAWPPASHWIGANPEMVAMIFTGINVVLRFITKDAIQLFDDSKKA